MTASRKMRLQKIRKTQENLESALLNLRRFGGEDSIEANQGLKDLYYLVALAKRAKVKEGK